MAAREASYFIVVKSHHVKFDKERFYGSRQKTHTQNDIKPVKEHTLD